MYTKISFEELKSHVGKQVKFVNEQLTFTGRLTKVSDRYFYIDNGLGDPRILKFDRTVINDTSSFIYIKE